MCLAVQIAKQLRALPVLEVGLPTLALVGAPNVGKSSLVQVGGWVQVWCGWVQNYIKHHWCSFNARVTV